jgi:DNA polymerase I-like protein with 3'-5' exonuclease and polymerase domains
VDIETQGDIKKLHHSERRLLCVGLHSPRLGTLIVPEELLMPVSIHSMSCEWPELADELNRLKLYAHNGKFDMATLGYGLGVQPHTIKLGFDTLLAHYVLNPAAGEHGLEPLSMRYLGAESWDVFSLAEKINLETQPTDKLHRYNALDVQYGWALAELFEPLLEADESALKAYYDVVMRASALFQRWEPIGIGFDPEYTRNELAENLAIEADRHRAELIRMAHGVLPRMRTVQRQRSKTVKDPDTGEKTRTVWKEPHEVAYEFNPGSWQQILVLYGAVGQHLVGTDAEIMQERADQGDKFATKLLEWRKVTKQLGTYVTSLLDKTSDVMGDWRLFPSYKIHGTVTSRLSSDGPNIQNIPREKKLRAMFVPFRPDRRLLQVDFGQAELRVIAAESGDPWLLELFHNPDVDVFEQMLPGVFPHVDFAQIDAATRKELRAKLKGVIYGLNFGRGARAIAHAIGSSASEAQRIIELFFTNAANVGPWREWVMSTVKTGEPLVSRFGRHFQNEVLTDRTLHAVQRSALSFLPQSNSSDVTLVSACEVSDYITAHRRDWAFVAIVHDAITLDVPEEAVEDAAQLVSGTMQAVAAHVFPEVPFTVDANWGRTWAETS